MKAEESRTSESQFSSKSSSRVNELGSYSLNVSTPPEFSKRAKTAARELASVQVPPVLKRSFPNSSSIGETTAQPLLGKIWTFARNRTSVLSASTSDQSPYIFSRIPNGPIGLRSLFEPKTRFLIAESTSSCAGISTTESSFAEFCAVSAILDVTTI